MASLLSKTLIVGVVLVGTLYQLVLHPLLFSTIGLRRVVQSITAFPHLRCEKVREPGLEACEDMWLHEPTGHLYMACSDAQSRTQWLPALGKLNASARGLRDRVGVLDTRGSGSAGERLKWLTVEVFDGVIGDGSLNLHGMSIRTDEHTGLLHVLLVNHRPPIDQEGGALLDANKLGANSTVEEFVTEVGSDTMRHVQTFADPLIATPNRVAWVTKDSFLVTNDNGFLKTGFRRELIPLFGGGNVISCSRSNCTVAYATGFTGPNGVVRGRDGLIYVPNTPANTIDVFTLTEKHMMTKIQTIKVGMPIDNLSVDRNGDIFAAGFPKFLDWAQSAIRPHEVDPPTTIFRIGRGDQDTKEKRTQDHRQSDSKDYWVETALEDDGSVLPGSTVAVHDVESGRFFVGGVMSPFIAICETEA